MALIYVFVGRSTSARGTIREPGNWRVLSRHTRTSIDLWLKGTRGVWLSVPLKHAHRIIGATRSGKTNYMLSEIDSSDEPFCVLDKHGNAARQLADSRECIYWRVADLSHPVALNPLQNVPPDERYLVTDRIVTIFSDIWGLGTQTSRLLYYLRAAIRILLDTHGTTLLDIRRVLSDGNYRASLLRRGTDKESAQTWDEFSHKPARQQADEISSLQNKVAALSAADPLRLILGQSVSTINFDKILQKGLSLVVDLSDIGDEPAALLGAIIINQFKQAADRRMNPTPYRLWIDEFQNFGTRIVSTILAESGKRELWLTLAHQFISQLDPEIRDAVLANCSTIVSFRLGPEDAPIIARALDWDAQDLQDLPQGKARVRTLLNGQPTSAYLLETKRVELPTGMLDLNIRHTRARYSRPRSLVEKPPRRKPRPSW
jgi:hypothetical protein